MPMLKITQFVPTGFCGMHKSTESQVVRDTDRW